MIPQEILNPIRKLKAPEQLLFVCLIIGIISVTAWGIKNSGDRYESMQAELKNCRKENKDLKVENKKLVDEIYQGYKEKVEWADSVIRNSKK